MNDVKYKGYDCISFNIKVTMNKRWIPTFLNMLKYMETLGGLGASRLLAFYSDGDGDFRPKFESEIDFPETTLDPKTCIPNDNGYRSTRENLSGVHRIYDAG